MHKEATTAQMARPLEDGGLGLEEPAVPRGWMRTERAGNARRLRVAVVGLRPCSDSEIKSYFIGIYQTSYQGMIDAIQRRYLVSREIQALELFLSTTDTQAIDQCEVEIVSKLLGHG